MRTWWTRFRPPTLEDRFLSRRNGLGLLRLVLALGVMVSHSWTLGFGWPGLGPLGTATHAQFNTLTVYGFFIISGFLITHSGMKTHWRPFTRRRFLRIFPGYWGCLLVTAFGLAPVAAWYENVNMSHFWAHPVGPLHYLWTNWLTSMGQYGIADLLTTTPYGRVSGGSVFDGSLWSLKYELACYVVVGILAAAGVLRRKPIVVLLLTLAFYLVIAIGFAATATTMPRPVFPGAVGPLPLVGSFNVNQTVYLAFMFLLGASIRLYQHRLPMSGVLAAVACVVLGLSLTFGAYVVVGLLAYAYVLFYLAVAAPARLCGVGRRHDYSYGVYLYSFPVQQMLALVGAGRFGLLPFILMSALGTFALAVPSWHFIERPAMGLKDRQFMPGILRRRRPRRTHPLRTESRPSTGRTG